MYFVIPFSIKVSNGWAKPREADGLYNRMGDIFYHFGSAFNNMKFRLFCPFLTIHLRTKMYTDKSFDLPGILLSAVFLPKYKTKL
jgi:hypothetical protein